MSASRALQICTGTGMYRDIYPWVCTYVHMCTCVSVDRCRYLRTSDNHAVIITTDNTWNTI